MHNFEEYIKSIDAKKWDDVLKIFQKLDIKNQTYEIKSKLILHLEKIPIKVFSKNIDLYIQIPDILFELGKVKKAKNLYNEIIRYLLEQKKLPYLKNLLVKIKDQKILPVENIFQAIEILEGKNEGSHQLIDNDNLASKHPDFFKNNYEYLEKYLLQKNQWTADDWKLAYEAIIRYRYQFSLFERLAEYALQLEKSEHYQNFLQEIGIKKKNKLETVTNSNVNAFNIDYDQLALEAISSGSINTEDEKRVLISLKKIEHIELLNKGQDMLIAFELLGMSQVVDYIASELIQYTNDVKKRASIYYVWSQSLLDSGETYKVIDLIEEQVYSEPLTAEELLAFEYIQAEAYLSLNKTVIAKKIFNKIKKMNPNYRLVRERLRTFENNK